MLTITQLENEGTENPFWACLCFSPLCHPEGPWTGNGSALPQAVIRMYKEVSFMVPGSQPAPYVLVSPCNYWWLMNNTSLYSSIYSRNRPKTQTTKTEIWGFWGCIFQHLQCDLPNNHNHIWDESIQLSLKIPYNRAAASLLSQVLQLPCRDHSVASTEFLQDRSYTFCSLLPAALIPVNMYRMPGRLWCNGVTRPASKDPGSSLHWAFYQAIWLWGSHPSMRPQCPQLWNEHFPPCCCCSVAQSCPTLCNTMECSTPGFPVLHHAWTLLELMSIESVMPSNHHFLCHPLLLPSVFPSIKVFSNEPALRIRWPKYQRFSFSISISNEYSQLISFRIDWFHLLVVQWTLIFSSTTVQKHLFFGAQSSLWSNSHIHTWLLKKTTALTMWTFVSKVMSLLLNMQSRFPLLFFQGASIF